jgi:hypothetical protein
MGKGTFNFINMKTACKFQLSLNYYMAQGVRRKGRKA